MYEPPHPRRVGPVLIAVLVVLAGAAGTGAYLVARAYLDGTAAHSVANGPSTPRGSTSVAGGAITPAAVPTSFPAPTGDACPAFTVAAVKAAGRPGSLKLALYIDAKATGTSGAEAWVCQDSDGSLYYQGHNKTGAATNATTDNTILIGPGIRGTVVMQGVSYTATNPSSNGETKYIVTREVLTVILPSGDKQEYQVTRSLPA